MNTINGENPKEQQRQPVVSDNLHLSKLGTIDDSPNLHGKTSRAADCKGSSTKAACHKLKGKLHKQGIIAAKEKKKRKGRTLFLCHHEDRNLEY